LKLPETIAGFQTAYRQKELTPREAVEGVLKRIEAVEPKVQALLWSDPQRLREAARQLEQGGGPTSATPLWGVPLLIKDNICVEGVPTTCASKILAGFKAPYDATVVARLKRAGALLVGMANMDEFAFGSSCEFSAVKPTRNPWDLQRVPGGSSGGSAAAVAARMIPGALGSDTGGSIRQPAAFCGVAGLKPTYGRVSRYGLVAFASSLDQIGPLTREVGDNARLLQVIAGQDPSDATSSDAPVPDYVKGMGRGIQGLRIGIPKEFFSEGLEAEVRTAVERAVEELKKAGAAVQPVCLPHTEYAIPTYYVLAPAEASSNLARFDGVRYGPRAAADSMEAMYLKSREAGFGPEAKRRIILGTFVLSSGYYDAYYGQALKARTLIKRDFDENWERVDALAVPTTPTAAFRLGEKLDDPLTMYLSDILTISVNLAGVPALSVPCGFTGKGLPIGLQLIAAPFAEETLFRIGGAYQERTDWHQKAAPCGN